ncbi:GH19137 [Drosophila grimshawi]|uniref:GH19137 n=2 Tax=Drosophila grimshawi TaxID=7222 RepID=B4JEK4_DROGR|nr:GH19137 [Drosophila grimshawi]
MCSASLGSEGSVTLQLRDASTLETAADSTTPTTTSTSTSATAAITTTATSNPIATSSLSSQSNGVTVLETSSSAASGITSALENALTVGYPDPEMLADVLGTIQTASLKNKHSNNSNNSNNNTSIKRSNNNKSSSTAATILTSSGIHLNSPNKITITRRSASNKISVQTVSTSTNTTISSIGGSKTNYIKNCLIRSSSCSNTATNVTTLAQILSNSSTSSAASLLSQHNNNSNCSNSSNFSIASSVGSIGSVSSNTSNTSSSSNCSSSNSNDSNSSLGQSLSFKSNGRNVAGIVTASTTSTSTAATGIGIVTVDNAPRKSRPKLSSPTRHGPQQCQICSKIFGNASALAKHKLTHSDERKYICALCSKAFKRQDHLNGHMMTHRNKKPYECRADGCGKSYCDARSLRRHSENHHGCVPTSESLSPTASTNGNVSNGISSLTGSGSSNSSSNGIGVATSSLSLSPATASGDASSPDGATCIRTYISTGSSIVDAATGIALSDEQIRAMNLPIKTGVTLLSPTTSTCSTTSSTASSMSCSSSGNGNGSSVVASSPTITLCDGATLEAEGLTREQLDLISKIMQQTKQTSAQVTVSSPTSVSSYKINTETAQVSARPRTWNMQLLNNVQNVTLTVDEGTELVASASSPPDEVKDDELGQQQLVTAINPHLLNIVKVDKPVECNLCHRKFKNVPALNGHMRLHGGYFKKDPETKRSEKKDSGGPPLQTASIGVRALIEEKIISKRKDINKGAFAVPAPPSSAVNSGVVSCNNNNNSNISSSNNNNNRNCNLRRSISDLESFLSPKSNANCSLSQALATSCSTTTTTAVLPAATTIKSSSGLSIQQIGLPQSIEIFSGGQRQPKTLSLGSGANTITITTNNVPTTTTMSALSALKGASSINSVSGNADPKDSTLIELLKRGTRIAVTSKKAQNTSTNLLLSNAANAELIGNSVQAATSRQIITNNNRTVIIPSDVHVVSTKSNKVSSNGASNANSISLPDGTPLSLTIGGNQESIGPSSISGGVNGVYAVTYTTNTDAVDLFGNAEVFNVSDTEMLLQTVDTMELLNNEEENEDEGHKQSEHSENFPLLNSVEDDVLIKLEPESGTPNTNTNTNTNTNPNQTTTPLPTFQQFHSKELIMQNSSQIQAIANMRGGVLSSPLHSPLAYPTPPSSHENVAQSSPFIEDAAAQFVDANHTFFGDKTDFSHVYFKTDDDCMQHQLNENDNEKILKLKTVLEESAFDASIKVEDLLNGTEDDAECDLREFAETNLSFLDEDQEFLNDSRNATSPLSESFFTSGIGSAEDVKQVLREVLPDENMQLQLSSEQLAENIIDLYYLPGLGLQSQMMSNSDDPLLSSSPRDFGLQRQVVHATTSATSSTVPSMDQLQSSGVMFEQQQQQLPPQRQQDEQQELQPQQQQQQLGIGQQPQQQQQSDFMLSNFTPVSCQTQYLDANQQSMTMQPLNNLLQPLLFGSNNNSNNNNHSIDKQQEFGTLLQTTNGQTSALDASLIFACGDGIKSNSNNNKSLIANLPAAAPVATPSPSFSNLQPLSNQTNSILKRRLRSNGAQDVHKFSKFHTLSPHRSKLRKPSRTHYTPAPILNPDRKGTGLYYSVRKQLGQNMFDAFDDDFGDPVGLVDFSDESKVNLGSTYQAQIPACKPLEEAIKETMCADMMWDPSVQIDDKILMRYIDLSKSSAVPMGSHSEEVALQALLEAKGNSAAAVLTLLQTQSSAFQMKWTAYELEQFLRGLERHGKDFGKIASELLTKTSGECVQMYYFWKKLCVDYKVSHLKMEPVPPSTPVVEQKPYVCEIADCSASFSSKAALHGHVRIHAYGRNASNSNNNNNNNNNQHATAISANNSNNHHSSSNSNNNTNNSNACAPQPSSNSNQCISATITATTTVAHTNGNNSSNTNTNANNNNSNNNNMNSNITNATGTSINPTLLSAVATTSTATKDSNSNNSNIAKDTEFPCKVCGKVFNKVKSRSAHMKTHRVQESEQSTNSKQQSATNANLSAVAVAVALAAASASASAAAAASAASVASTAASASAAPSAVSVTASTSS